MSCLVVIKRLGYEALAGWTTYDTGRAAFPLFQGHKPTRKLLENRFKVVFQWERLPARNAGFLPFPGLLRQCGQRVQSNRRRNLPKRPP
jgi:hypothetical protein